MTRDVIIVGGGPAGLSAALTLGRGRKHVLLCDAGTPRNAAAVQVHNFVTRDGTPPPEFRRIARRQLESYASVEVRDERVEGITGMRGAFEVRLESGSVEAWRVLLCTGMVDVLPDIPGFRDVWGSAAFACPYCHGWEIRDKPFGFLASSVDALDFAIFLRGWTDDVVALTNGAFPVPSEVRERLSSAGVTVDERRIARLASAGERLEHIEFVDGGRLSREALFHHPRQHQVALVQALALTLDDAGYVRVDEKTRETSTPGIHAAGDLTSPVQSAILAAAAGMSAAAAINRELTIESATLGVTR